MKRKQPKGGAKRRRGSGTGPKLALAIVTAINLALTLALSVMRRQEVLRAVNQDGAVKLLLEQEAAKHGQE